MKITTKTTPFTFEITIESENATIKLDENLALRQYLVDPDFKNNLMELFRGIALYENTSLSSVLCGLLTDDETDDILYDLNVID